MKIRIDAETDVLVQGDQMESSVTIPGGDSAEVSGEKEILILSGKGSGEMIDPPLGSGGAFDVSADGPAMPILVPPASYVEKKLAQEAEHAAHEANQKAAVDEKAAQKKASAEEKAAQKIASKAAANTSTTVGAAVTTEIGEPGAEAAK